MTREAKIGLLVALAFILVIGILLSDHVTSATREPAAPLALIEDAIRGSTSTPGGAVAQPQSPPQLPGDATPSDTRPYIHPANPPQQQAGGAVIVDLGTPQNRAQQTSDTQATQADPWGTGVPLAQNSTPAGSEQPPVPDNQPAAPAPETPQGILQQQASRAGVPLVPVDSRGGAASPDSASSGIKEYTIQPGDSLSKIVARHLGRYTPANEAILLGLNPRLQSGKDRIIAGQKLMVPATASAVESLRAAATSSPPSASPPPRTQGSSAAGRTYVVKDGDTLWSIAAKQLGSGARHEEILKLNAQKLSGADELQVGMKLKLPG